MKEIIRNTLAVVLGLVIGGAVNMGIIMISGSIIPPPNGADLTTPEGLKAALPLFEPKHFIMPFLAHALGTFVGALLAVIIASKHKTKFAALISILFLIGGIINVFSLPSPMWYNVVDLVGAYLPMGYLAWKLGLTKRNSSENLLRKNI